MFEFDEVCDVLRDAVVEALKSASVNGEKVGAVAFTDAGLGVYVGDVLYGIEFTKCVC